MSDQLRAPAHDFTGRTVIVTGAAQGIGLAISRYFTAAGADLLMVDRDEDALLAAATELDADSRPADVSNSSDVERAVSQAIEKTGRIDVLVNNAGILRDRVIWKLEDEDWDAVIDVHLGGSFRLIRACVPYFRERSYGRVINVTSYTGLHGNIGQSAYAAAKAGIVGLTKTAAKELGRFGTTVNAISPNARTRMVDSMPDDVRESIRGMIALGRYAEPGEITGAVGFLASEEAAYVTGVVLPVDGGLAM